MTAKFIHVVILCTLLGCLSACKSRSPGNMRNIRPYYYPIEHLEDGMMFVYKYRDDLLPPALWHLRFSTEAGAQYLYFTELDDSLTVKQTIKERIFPSGSKIVAYTITERDSTGHRQTAQMQILSGDVFPFWVEDNGGVYIFEAKWFFPHEPEVKYTLVRNRRYSGDTTFVFKGRKIPAVKFSVKELVETEINGSQELTFDLMEVYAKGLGLVASERRLNDSLALAFVLTDTIRGQLMLPH